MAESNPVRFFGKVCKKILGCQVLCLAVLFVAVGCSDSFSDPLDSSDSSESEHIDSPYTEQTIEFFEKGRCEEYPNGLKTIAIFEKRHILKKQFKKMCIYTQNHTLETVPDQLAQGMMFRKITLTTTHGDVPASLAVLEKILGAFGTLCADKLVFDNLPTNTETDGGENRLGNFETTAPLAKCILNVSRLHIFTNTAPAIKWIQERVDLSQCQTYLTIFGGLELDNLEALDGFNTEEILELTLKDFKRLDSLDCKLFREGSLPDGLYMHSKDTLTPKISDEVAKNMFAKYWVNLNIPMKIWEELMESNDQPEHLTVALLRIALEPGCSIPTPVEEVKRVRVSSLTIDFNNWDSLVTTSHLEQTLEWVSTGFEGLVSLSVLARDAPPELTDFARNNRFVISTNPNLKHIEFCAIECLHDPNIVPNTNILCFSLEAWELYTKGKLADELGQADLCQLSPEHRAIVMSKEEMGGDSDPCHVCLCSADDLRSSSPDTQICILDRAKHTVCARCLDGLIKRGRDSGSITCPMCRERVNLSLLKHRIHRNAQGQFELAICTQLPVLSFPRTNPNALPAI
ncbi:hypothetical protein NEDG_02116 [Nematocida displodere]|uniref:RING-type domain-containing protein n=1 Tax=Nematocida displodere TaxID=1805483 RepID=A0A177EJS0_9MICR|nr:hypothetical protein NEDG_02116 [Nematocida displodere]